MHNGLDIIHIAISHVAHRVGAYRVQFGSELETLGQLPDLAHLLDIVVVSTVADSFSFVIVRELITLEVDILVACSVVSNVVPQACVS